MVFYNVYLILHIALGSVGIVFQIAIFFRQKQLNKQLSVDQWVVCYINGKVTIRRKSQYPTFRKLWKHDRNVISPLGSFLSYEASAVYNIILISYMYFNIGSPIIGEFLFFSVHSVYFFCLNFIETMCSPNLRNSLFQVPQMTLEYRIQNI